MSARTNLLVLAIAASLAPLAAQAVSVDPRGSGQVLLFPYYTANGGNQTLLSVVNTTERVKGIRVRFREGLNSRVVYDFNLYLAPFDTWVGAVFRGSTGEDARIVTNDTSCALPEFTPGEGRSFRNYQYTGISQDFPSSQGALASLARTREGHVEMIEMGELTPGTGPTQLAEEASFATGAAQPRDCTRFRAVWTPPTGEWTADRTRDITAPTGGLFGSGAVVDVANGVMVSYPAIALADFYTDSAAPGGLHFSPGFDQPDLTFANNGGGVARAEVQVDGIGPTTEEYATGSANPVSLVLLQSAIFNDFVADPAIGGSTEWVVTFPTRGYYADVGAGTTVPPPFSNPFRDDGRSAEPVLPFAADREALDSRAGCDFGGVPPPGCGDPIRTLDYSVNVIAFASGTTSGATPILGSTRAQYSFDFASVGTGLPSGWMRIGFAGGGVSHGMRGPTTGLDYAGMPAIGFSASRIINGNARPGLIANYAGAQPHRGTLAAGLIVVD